MYRIPHDFDISKKNKKQYHQKYVFIGGDILKKKYRRKLENSFVYDVNIDGSFLFCVVKCYERLGNGKWKFGNWKLSLGDKHDKTNASVSLIPSIINSQYTMPNTQCPVPSAECQVPNSQYPINPNVKDKPIKRQLKTSMSCYKNRKTLKRHLRLFFFSLNVLTDLGSAKNVFIPIFIIYYELGGV